MGRDEGGGRQSGGVRVIVHDMPQRSPEWYAVRLGKLTASRAGDMLAQIKSGEAAARRDYRTQLVCERLTSTSQDDVFINDAMQRGMDKEADAFAAYEALTGELAHTVGFISHDTIMAGCSPDGVIGDFAGVLECKCPKSATHLKYLRAGVVPPDYLPQLTHTLWITGAPWIDFVSFDDRFPDPLRVFHVRVQRADVDVLAYELAATLFLSEVEREVAELTTRSELAVA